MHKLSEREKLADRPDNDGWKKWGPYLAERQWGTVREDYSVYGDAWDFLSHDMARSKAYRWGEDGIGGISDNKQKICIAFAFWNHHDSILKERLFGLTNKQGNHGEDVKELYYYLDSSPTHSYMKMLYKYPIKAFPYQQLLDENAKRNREQEEYELVDTGIFNNNEYFDIFIEYAKSGIDDICIKITAHNRSNQAAKLDVLPTMWFRNTWAWDKNQENTQPSLKLTNGKNLSVEYPEFGKFKMYFDEPNKVLFCDNETNTQRTYGKVSKNKYFKDGINNYVVNANNLGINPSQSGTKASALHTHTVQAHDKIEVRLRFSADTELENPFVDFDYIFNEAKASNEDFYAEIQKNINSEEQKAIQRQAFAGMMWNKQFYYYDLEKWTEGDELMPFEFQGRVFQRNSQWQHARMANILSMPDKWEYPWFAAWDLAFHTPTLASIDPDFAKRQLAVILREYYMHPNGQIPAYEWNFSDVNPPVHAWATWKVYEIDKANNGGKGDLVFLERVFHKLLLNFTWWVNQKDEDGNNLFGGGFLGLDNIGVFDRNAQIPGINLQQADATGWMAIFTLNMLKISCEISLHNPAYQDMASKFFEHFLHIAEAINKPIEEDTTGLWDENDGFYYDKIYTPDSKTLFLKIKSLVGLIPLCAVEVISQEVIDQLPDFKRRLAWIAKNKPQLHKAVANWQTAGPNGSLLFSLVNETRMRSILQKLFDETEFLSQYGIRSLSKDHLENPYMFDMFGEHMYVHYTPAESELSIMGGNSNWRGPIWFPLNYLIIDALHKYADYFGDDFKADFAKKGSIDLRYSALEISMRLISIFLKTNKGSMAFNGNQSLLNTDPHFKDYYLFHEYFDGDNARGLGANHQTGWTGLVANLIHETNLLNSKDS